MNNEIISVIDALCEKFGIAIDWGTENVFPAVQDLITRYTNYLFMQNTFSLIISIIGMIISLIILIKASKDCFNKKSWTLDKHDSLSNLAFACLLCGGIGTIFSIIASFNIANNIFKLITIPEIYTIQEILKMLEK